MVKFTGQNVSPTEDGSSLLEGFFESGLEEDFIVPGMSQSSVSRGFVSVELLKKEKSRYCSN